MQAILIPIIQFYRYRIYARMENQIGNAMYVTNKSNRIIQLNRLPNIIIIYYAERFRVLINQSLPKLMHEQYVMMVYFVGNSVFRK